MKGGGGHLPIVKKSQEPNFDCKDIYIENYIFVLLEFLANVHKCSLDAITQMLRCFSSPGGMHLTQTPFSRALRLVCQVANIEFQSASIINRFPRCWTD